MKQIKQVNLRELVQRSIRDNWQAFETNHPRLARVCDQDLLAETLTESLLDDPEYQETMADAYAAGVAARVAGDLVRRLVSKALKQLI